MEKINAPICGQASDLIAFLYGELNTLESQAFQHHLQGCSECSGDFAAFGGIRKSVIAWRDESLGGMSSSAPVPYVAAGSVSRNKPSAMAAFREFFNLSPVWMKGAVAFATLLFCVLAGLTVARFQSNESPVAASSPQPDKAHSEQQLNALVDQRVQEELQRLKNSPGESPAPELVMANPANRFSHRRLVTRGSEAVNISLARRPLSKGEREQLAADLRLVASNNDNDLELLDDRINQ